MAGFSDKVKVEIEVSADTKQAETRVQTVEKQLEGLSNEQAKIVLDANITELESKLKAAKKDITNLSDEDVKLQLEVIGDGEAQLRDLKDMADKLDSDKVSIDVDSSQVDSALEGTRGHIDEVGKSADSSKSVLANMVGNSVQDLGDLGGVAGSAGVAIGQMGEYFADATLAGEGFASALGSFAVVAGPVAALAVATAVLPSLLDAITASSGPTREEIKALADEMDNAAGQSDAWTAELKKLITTDDDLESAMTQFGVTVGGLNQAILTHTQVLGAGREQASNMVQEFNALHDTENGTVGTIQKMADARGITFDVMYKQYQQAKKLVDVTQEEAEKYDAANRELDRRRTILTDLTTNTTSATQATIDQGLADQKLEDSYKTLVEARKRGIDITGKTVEAIQSEIDAYDHARTAQETQAEALVETTQKQAQALSALGDSLDELPSKYNAVEGAASAMAAASGEVRGAMFATHQSAADAEEGFEGLVKQLKDAPASFKETGDHISTFNQTGRDLLDTLEQQNQKVGEVFSTILKGGGSYDDVRAKATDYRGELVKQFNQLGITSDEQENYLQFLGLTPEQVETTIKLSQADEARQKIALLNIDINSLPATARTEYIAAINQGDYQTALAILTKLADPPGGYNATVGVDADTSAADQSVNAFIRSIEQKKAYIDVGARTGNTPVARAGGGPVTAGQMYVVGEDHAELFVPDRNGAIIPDVPPPGYYSSWGGVHTGAFDMAEYMKGYGAPDGYSADGKPYWTGGGLGARPAPTSFEPGGSGNGMVLSGSGGGGGGSWSGGDTYITNHITVNLPPGSDGEDVVKALKRYERRNGVVPVRTL